MKGSVKSKSETVVCEEFERVKAAGLASVSPGNHPRFGSARNVHLIALASQTAHEPPDSNTALRLWLTYSVPRGCAVRTARHVQDLNTCGWPP